MAIRSCSPSPPSYNGGQTFQLADATAPNDSGALVPGTYSVSEGAVTDWDPDERDLLRRQPRHAPSACQPGETVTCTFTNTKRGVIIVDKVTVPAGASQLFTFTPSYNGGQTFQLADATAPNNSGGLLAGTYSVSEATVAGWDLTSVHLLTTAARSSAISLQPGEVITCTFTNTQRGHILIDKVTDPSGDPATFEFDSNYGANFTLTDAQTPNDSGALVPGTYSVAELALAGWDLTGTSCSDDSPVGAISLQPGETVTCTFTNTKRGTIIVEKQTSPDGATGDFTFTRRRLRQHQRRRRRSSSTTWSRAPTPRPRPIRAKPSTWAPSSATTARARRRARSTWEPPRHLQARSGRDHHLRVHQRPARDDHDHQGCSA